jgi:hypothetical protein
LSCASAAGAQLNAAKAMQMNRLRFMAHLLGLVQAYLSRPLIVCNTLWR